MADTDLSMGLPFFCRVIFWAGDSLEPRLAYKTLQQSAEVSCAGRNLLPVAVQRS